MDCSDSDCSYDSSCQTGETTNSSTNINYIPIQAGIPDPFISDRSLSLSSLLKNNLSLLKQQNETVIVSAMKQIETKAAANAYDELPALMEKAQNYIDTAEAFVDRNTTDLYILKTENELTTSDVDVKAKMDVYISATNNLLKDYTAYFKILEKFLVESIPTPDLYSSLNRSISDLKNSGEEYELELTKLTSAIDSKNTLRQKSVSITAFTPVPGSSVSYHTVIEKISIEFNKPIEKYLGGTIVISGSDISTFEAAILPVNSGDYSISASVPSLSAGKTYSVTANIQLQFEGKGHSLKNTNTWTFRIEQDTTNITDKTDEDDKEDKDDGSSGEEKCKKKKGFWSRLKDLFSRCKPAPDICCLCVFSDSNTTNPKHAQTFVKSCTDQIAESKCTESTSRYTPTHELEIKAQKDFAKVCPVEEFDDVKYLKSIHGFNDGDETEVCEKIPERLIEGYVVSGGKIPQNITMDSQSCNDINDYREAEQAAENLMHYLKGQGHHDVTVTIRANQNSVAYEPFSGRSFINTCTRTTFKVCSSSVEEKLSPCPDVGSLCHYTESEDSDVRVCSDDGAKSSRTCKPNGSTTLGNGTWQ
jgi:hypothetical protein